MSAFKLTVAPTGARRQKTDHPNLPISIKEIATTAKDCFQAGAHEIHLHIRDDNGRHSLDPNRYQKAIKTVKKTVPEMAIQISTESAGIYDVHDQLACLEDVRPEAASMAIREFARDKKLAERAYAIAQETKTQIQHILYTNECIDQLFSWFENGTIPKNQRNIIFVLGKYAPPKNAKPEDLYPLLDAVKRYDLTWAVCAFGKNEQQCLLKAVKMGGNARIGFENNIKTPNGNVIPNNATSVYNFIRAAQSHNLSLKGK